MNKITQNCQLSGIKGGDLTTFCAGYAAGVGVGLSLGWTLGPVGIGVVILAGGACLLGDSSK
ncbi:hypothetical protein ABID42_003467 [Arcicella rosea]|uniref:hypothetical protein n=1 Tax=Arcicella rosea TaxID=502909 RepID=UPI00345CA485